MRWGVLGSNSNVVLVCTDHLERVLGHSVLAEYAVEVLAGIGGTAVTNNNAVQMIDVLHVCVCVV